MKTGYIRFFLSCKANIPNKETFIPTKNRGTRIYTAVFRLAISIRMNETNRLYDPD